MMARKQAEVEELRQFSHELDGRGDRSGGGVVGGALRGRQGRGMRRASWVRGLKAPAVDTGPDGLARKHSDHTLAHASESRSPNRKFTPRARRVARRHSTFAGNGHGSASRPAVNWSKLRRRKSDVALIGLRTRDEKLAKSITATEQRVAGLRERLGVVVAEEARLEAVVMAQVQVAWEQVVARIGSTPVEVLTNSFRRSMQLALKRTMSEAAKSEVQAALKALDNIDSDVQMLAARAKMTWQERLVEAAVGWRQWSAGRFYASLEALRTCRTRTAQCLSPGTCCRRCRRGSSLPLVSSDDGGGSGGDGGGGAGGRGEGNEQAEGSQDDARKHSVRGRRRGRGHHHRPRARARHGGLHPEHRRRRDGDRDQHRHRERRGRSMPRPSGDRGRTSARAGKHGAGTSHRHGKQRARSAHRSFRRRPQQ